MGSGVTFRLEVELGAMPFAFFTGVEQAVRTTLLQGVHGWDVIDCVVSMTHSGYYPRQSHMHGSFDASMSSTAGDFRNLTPLVLMDALQRAGTRVLEPIHRFDVEIPADALSPVLALVVRLRGVPLDTQPRGSGYLLSGDLPAARVPLGGRRVRVDRPRMRAVDGMGELAVPAYELFSQTEVLGRMA